MTRKLMLAVLVVLCWISEQPAWFQRLVFVAFVVYCVWASHFLFWRWLCPH